MEPISNSDRLIMVLRQKLKERSAKSKNSGTASAVKAATPQEPSAVKAMAAAEGGDERQLRRAVIQNLLADQLGPELLNDAQFQQVVSRVTDTIEEDSNAAQLLTRVIADLRTEAK